MRILYSFPDTIGKPGIGTTALHQVKGLAEHGHAVHLFCTSGGSVPPEVRRLVSTLTVFGVRLPHRTIGRARSYRYHDWRVATWLRRHSGQIDVVHVWPGGTLHTAAAAKGLGIPVVREVPNAHTAYARAVVARELQHFDLELPAGHSHRPSDEALARELREYEAVDLLLAPSSFVAGTLVDHGVPADRVAIHRYGCDPRRFSTGASGNGKTGLTMLFMGRCEPRKGLHYALRAWLASGLAESGSFIICGNFVPGYREALGGLLAHPSIDVRGFVDDPGGVMRESELFVLPSVEEGSALVTYEAQYAGCVPLVSDATGAPCEHLVNGLVHRAGDLGELTEHLTLLRTDPALLERLRIGAEGSKATLTWAYATEQLVDAYKRCVPAADGAGAARTLDSLFDHA